jgi:hypothetical protein
VKHLTLLIGMMITCVLAAVANVVASRVIGLNFFTVKVWFVIPAGAMVVGMLGTSGAILAARYFNIRPTLADAVLMVIVSAGTMLLIYYLDFMTFVLDDGRKASDLVDFSTFVDVMLTKSHMRVTRAARDVGEVGQMGYLLALVEFVGFLIGGASMFGIIRGQLRCPDCDAYLRKLKTKKTKELTIDEADQVVRLFRGGDISIVQQLMAWAPAARSLDKEKAVVNFDLYGCPKCKTELIVAKVSVFDGREWKEVPTVETRRQLTEGLSLRDQFG